MNIFKTSLAAIVMAALPMMSAAATTQAPVRDIDVNQLRSFSISITPSGDTFDRIAFRFKALSDFTINAFSVSGTGAIRDLRNTSFRIEPAIAELQPFQKFTQENGIGGASAVADGSVFKMGDVFRVIFKTTAKNDISFTTSFATVPSAVPVPAAGLLLLTALGGAAALRRRKKATVAA